jgi:4,5-dihydroxyphthalate decarboxylase
MVEIALEAQGARPNFRYDIMQPLMQGRASIDGAELRPAGVNDLAGFFDKPRFKSGDFGLLDINMGDVVPTIAAGWDLCCLPIFIKRKPVYNYLWVRADRGIEQPKDLEGKTFGTVGYSSSISIYTRGFLQHFHGVDLTTLRWLVNGPGPFPISNPAIRIDQASGPPKSSAQRLLDGEIDASTGDITDLAMWRALESSPVVKRFFPDYQAENLKLWKDHAIYTPVHIMVIGGKLNREQPDIARKVYDAFERSRQIAYEDAMSDATGYSIKSSMRELLRDEVGDLGELYTHGLSRNAAAVDLFLDFCQEQGVTPKRLSREEVFAASTLDT